MRDKPTASIPKPIIGLSGPPLSRSLGELLTPLEFGRLALIWWTLPFHLRGNGETVMLLPGLGGSELSMTAIREYLKVLGYDVHDWGLGRNQGNVIDLLPAVAERVQHLVDQAGKPISLVGWSLGGYLARETARDYPRDVSQVITMGSPVFGGPKYTATAHYFGANGRDMDRIEARIAERFKRPIKVPITSIYSKNDGVVSWQASIDNWSPNVDHVEVRATHLGLGFSRDVLKILAEKLHRRA